MRRYTYILLFAAVALSSSCVYEFHPKNIKDQTDILVIEGDIIVGDESAFVISKSTVVDDYEKKAVSVQPTDIYVEAEDGTKYGGARLDIQTDDNYNNSTKYTYIIDTEALDGNVRYRLVVYYSDKQYTSGWEKAYETPDIDNVTYEIADKNSGVQIYVNSTNTINDNRFYKWNFVEDWEFKSDFYSEVYYLPDSNNVYERPYTENIYYCWRHHNSTSINVLNTTSLAENKVANQRIEYISSNDFRISYIYAIEVHQMCISKDAYSYWETMLRNNDQTGGIFSPQPNEMRGNIVCTDDPDLTVLGYISVGSVSKQRIFLYHKDLKVYNVRRLCTLEDKPRYLWRELALTNWEVVYRDIMSGQVFWAHRKCVDCRVYGNKNKPDFWPSSDI